LALFTTLTLNHSPEKGEGNTQRYCEQPAQPQALVRRVQERGVCRQSTRKQEEAPCDRPVARVASARSAMAEIIQGVVRAYVHHANASINTAMRA